MLRFFAAVVLLVASGCATAETPMTPSPMPTAKPPPPVTSSSASALSTRK
jgi:hypothetical protein